MQIRMQELAIEGRSGLRDRRREEPRVTNPLSSSKLGELFFVDPQHRVRA